MLGWLAFIPHPSTPPIKKARIESSTRAFLLVIRH